MLGKYIDFIVNKVSEVEYGVRAAKTSTVRAARKYIERRYRGRKIAFVDTSTKPRISHTVISRMYPDKEWGILVREEPTKFIIPHENITYEGVVKELRAPLGYYLTMEETMPVDYIIDTKTREVILRNNKVTISVVKSTYAALLLEIRA